MYKTGDIYKYYKSQNTKMLSNFQPSEVNNDFWADYRTNYARYDAVFNRMFNSFWYFLQDSEGTIAEVATDFTQAVYDHLMINEKKYSELYRIEVIPDEDYSLTNNYNITEVMDKDITDNNDNTYGQRIDSGSFTEGSRSDSASNTLGSQTTTVTDGVAPYDSDVFSNNKESETVAGSRQDSSSFTKGSQSDSSSNTKGQQIDNLDRTYTEDYTLTREGNIGVQTATDMIDKHKKFWSLWAFYEYIFKEISKDLLLI